MSRYRAPQPPASPYITSAGFMVYRTNSPPCGIDRSIRYLQKRLPDLKVVTQLPSDQTRVFFGAWVALEDEDGKPVIYRIVGPAFTRWGGASRCHQKAAARDLVIRR